MYQLVKINGSNLHLMVVEEDNYLDDLQSFIKKWGVRVHLFVSPHERITGEYRVLPCQCALVQALLNLHSEWLRTSFLTPVPEGVYVKGEDWFIDAAVGNWKIGTNDLIVLRSEPLSTDIENEIAKFFAKIGDEIT